MERSVLTSFIATFSLTASLVSCDKTETAAKKFMKEGRWVVTELSVADNPVDKLPKWNINTCEHSTQCSGTWEHSGGTTAGFQWAFSNFSGNFSFQPEPPGEQITMAYSQCLNFSGEYKVIKSKNNLFHFESSATTGYPGKMVTLIIEQE